MSRLVMADGDYYRANEADALPIRWMALESMDTYKFTLKTDVWSFGVVCFEVFSYGETPYGSINNVILAMKVLWLAHVIFPLNDSGRFKMVSAQSNPLRVPTMCTSSWVDAGTWTQRHAQPSDKSTPKSPSCTRKRLKSMSPCVPPGAFDLIRVL